MSERASESSAQRTALRSPTALPEITPEWLTRILARRTPGVEVGEVSVDSVIWGTATKVMLRSSAG
jgi:hypothetical protein